MGLRDELPKIIYHYCSIDSFKAILHSKSLRLSQVSSMNDYYEYTWIRKVIVNEMKKRRDPEGDNYKMSFGEFLFQDYVNTKNQKEVYCVCFSAAEDELSQWRAYGDNAAGFAIGFKTESIRKEWGTDGQFDKFLLGQVIYDKEKQGQIAAGILEQMIHYSNSLDGEINDNLRDIEAKFEELADPYAVVMKNPRFRQEEEWRLVVKPGEWNDDNTLQKNITKATTENFYVRGKELIHFIPFQFWEIFEDPYPIAEIWLGPKNPAIQNERALDWYKRCAGSPHAIVRHSEASFR